MRVDKTPKYQAKITPMEAVELDARLKGKIEINPFSDCWEWTGYTSPNGYGKIKHNGRVKPVHRVAYALWVREIRRGNDIHHTCRCRHCINPAHLQQVSLHTNRADNQGEKIDVETAIPI